MNYEIRVPYPEVGQDRTDNPAQKKGQLANAMSGMIQRLLYEAWEVLCDEAEGSEGVELTGEVLLHGVRIEVLVSVVRRYPDKHPKDENGEPLGFLESYRRTLFGRDNFRLPMLGFWHHIYFEEELPHCSAAGGNGAATITVEGRSFPTTDKEKSCQE